MVFKMIKKFVTAYSLSLVSVLYAVQLDTLIIESSKLNENQMDLPATIDVLDSKQLSVGHINSFQNLSSALPNTNISGLGNRSDATVTMRGIANYLTTESSVAVYVDDAPIPFSYGFGAIDFSHIDRVEVFKGAQGTDFGKNAESGVINLYTKPITDALMSEAQLDYGSYDSKKFYGRVSGSSGIDKIGFAFSFTDNRTDGYTVNEITHDMLDHRHMSNFNAKLKYDPNSHFTMALNYTKTKIDDGGTAFKIDTKNNPYSITNEPQNDWVKMDNDLLSLIIKYTQNDISVTSVSSYGRQSIQKDDYIAILGGLDIGFDTHIEEISQEFRLNGIYKNIDYVLGGFYSDKLRFNAYENQRFTSLPSYNNTNIIDNLDTNIALFAKVRYAINNYVSLTSGLRYQQTKRDFTRDYTAYPSVLSSTESWNHWLPTFSLSYDKEGDTIYLTYSKGYRAGGYNYRSPGTTLVPYKPEITESLELGYKKAVDSAWNMSNALFYNRIHDVRTLTLNDYLATTTLNADRAHSYGFESSLKYSSERMDLYGSVGITKTEFDRFVSGSVDYAGKHLLDVPDMTLSVGGKYQLDPYWYTTASLAYMGKRYYDIANTAQENGYTTVNTAIGYRTKKWKAEVYANNLFDSEYSDFMMHTPSHNYYHFGTPRIIGFSLGMMFE